MEENYEQKEYAIDPDADSRRLYLYCYDGTGLLGMASLVALFAVMLLFYCLGNGVRLLLDRFDRQNEEKVKQEQEEKAEQEDAVSEDAQQKGVSESNG